jgi:hypothetical protein
MERHGRCRNINVVAPLLVVSLLLVSVSGAGKKGRRIRSRRKEITASLRSVLWCPPADLASRNLFYGPGGKNHEPHTTFTFVTEDLSGSSPKFEVRDEEGTRWKVKLGQEARPETVASRLVWAVGYYANEDYFVPVLHVQGLPGLSRGQDLISADGSINNVRLKRYLKGENKVGIWRWRRNRFGGTRELNGLRVMMALLNNWDLKDDNNSVYEEEAGENYGSPELHYMVSDLGASFGSTARRFSSGASKGNLNSYQHSKFIRKVTPQYVDFGIPATPSLILVFSAKAFITSVRMRWIGRHIPRSDARWMAQLLAQLSPSQIRDAFRAADYSPGQVEAFAEVLQERIAELKGL